MDYPNEYITSVEGTCDLVSSRPIRVRSLSFKTSKERTSPTYGKVGKQTFVLESKGRALVGFHGRAGWAIDAIGAYFGSPPMEKLPGKGGDRGASWDDGGFDGVKKIYVGLGENGVASLKFVYDKNNQVVLGEDHGKKTVLGYEEVIILRQCYFLKLTIILNYYFLTNLIRSSSWTIQMNTSRLWRVVTVNYLEVNP